MAGTEVGQPGSIEEITPAWLTDVLRTSGAVDASTSVTALDCEPFAVGAGLLSLLYRATPTYDGPSAGPVALIVKLPTTDPLQRGIADALGFYAREIDFYRNLAPRVPVRFPAVHAAMIATDSTDFAVVMEDLSDRRTHDQRTGVPWDDAVRAVAAVAPMHAAWEGRPELAQMAGLYLPILNDGYLAQLPQIFADGWSHAKVHGADVLTPEVVAYGDRYGDVVGFLLETLYEEPTLIHGDWRADNLFFDDDGVIAIDPQIMGIGTGPYDLGYFVSQSIESDVRAGREAELIDRYVAALSAAGADPDRGDVERRFGVAVAHCLIYAVSSFHAWDALPERSRELMVTILRRATSAIIDLDATSLLPR